MNLNLPGSRRWRRRDAASSWRRRCGRKRIYGSRERAAAVPWYLRAPARWRGGGRESIRSAPSSRRRRCDRARRPSLQHRANLKWDGLFCSNGPGDPSQCKETIKSLQWAISKDIPIFGICLGNQLLALAAGAKTYKMKYGNRGMNQPCVDLRTTRCYITSQNHGYAVDDQSLPEGWKALFVNANDRADSVSVSDRFRTSTSRRWRQRDAMPP